MAVPLKLIEFKKKKEKKKKKVKKELKFLWQRLSIRR